jgi:hypothetical protein
MRYFVRASLPLLAVAAFLATGSARAAVTCSSAPSVVVSKTGEINVFVIGSDGKAYQRRMAHRDEKAGAPEARPADWITLEGQCRHGIAATSHLGRMDVFTVAKNGHLVHKTFTKDGWSKEWADVGATPGGKCTSAPAAVTSLTGRLDVLVVGNDNKVHQATLNPARTGWKWGTVGGDTRFGVGAARHLSRLDVFAVARNGHVAQKTYSKEWSKEFADRGAPAEKVKADSAPAALASTTGQFNVFVLGNDKKCYHLSGSGDTFNWANLGGECLYGVCACSHLKSKAIFTVARGGHLVKRNHDGSAWGKEWLDLGQPAN